MKRSDIKNNHEASVLERFRAYLSLNNHILNVIKRPDPPDAIVILDGRKTWIEITDAFFCPELAESITSHVADDKIHKPVPKEKRFCIEPDEQYSEILKNAIINKYEKNSLGKVYKQYGSGILLVGIVNPFSDARAIINSEKQTILKAIESRERRFNEIYLYDVHEDVFCKLL